MSTNPTISAPCRLVFLGPPASGKGTQAELLKDRFGFLTPSVGAMLRAQKAAGTELGLRAATFFERGLLVPDDVSTLVVREWLAANDGASWVLDGYPRSLGQAEALEKLLAELHAHLNLAILFHADESVIRDRIARRLICNNCGGVYSAGLHIPGAETPCPRCGHALTRRNDDNPETLADRLTEYRNKTEPLISYFEKRGLLHTIDSNRPIETVFSNLIQVMQNSGVEIPQH